VKIYFAGLGGHIDLTHPTHCRLTEEQNSLMLDFMRKLPEFEPILESMYRRLGVKIYGSINKFDYELTKEALTNVLVSFAYMKDSVDWAIELNENYDLFVDSGAFSARHSGAEIDIDEYIEWLGKVEPEVIAGLDVIGDPIATEKNIAYMEEAGLVVLPTYHPGEELHYLKAMVERYDYIALGGIASLGERTKAEGWLKKSWRTIYEMGRTDLKVHGFGMTNKELMGRFPWHSVDSTSWLAGVRFGRIERSTGEMVHVDTWLREQHGNEDDNPDFWLEENDVVRRKVILLAALEQVQRTERELTEHYLTYDWEWLTQQYELL